MKLITGNRQDHISNDSYQEKQVSFILPQSCHPATLGHLPGATRSFKGHQFEFRNNETRRPPSMQTTQSIFKLTALQRARNVSHFLGQKGPTMFSTLLKFDYCSFNFVEWMHNLARAFDNLMDFLVGRDAKFDARCRRGVQTLGIFRDV